MALMYTAINYTMKTICSDIGLISILILDFTSHRWILS